MRISEKKKTELYSAISDQIMDARVSTRNSKNVLGEKNADDIDAMLFRLNQKIWNSIEVVLGIND